MNETTVRPIQFSLRGLLIVTAICGAILFLFFTSPTTFFHHVTVGMSRGEVLEILGEPESQWNPTENWPETWQYRRHWIDLIDEDRYFVTFGTRGLVERTGEVTARRRADGRPTD